MRDEEPVSTKESSCHETGGNEMDGTIKAK
jgi:hypothetical protein